jgi:hypothetical protein
MFSVKGVPGVCDRMFNNNKHAYVKLNNVTHLRALLVRHYIQHFQRALYTIFSICSIHYIFSMHHMLDI